MPSELRDSLGPIEPHGEAPPKLAYGPDGTLYALYAVGKVVPGRGFPMSALRLAQSSDDGRTWTPPVPVHADNWVFDGCPHAGPSLQVDAAGIVHVAWWTGKQGSAGVFYARSTDRGCTFAEPTGLGVAEFSGPAHAQLALGDSGAVVAVWDDGTVRTPRVVMRVSHDSGLTFGAATLVSTEGRAATFPVLSVRNRDVTVAWSEQSEAAHDHEQRMMPNMNDPKAVKALSRVGESSVRMRTGRLQ